MLAGLCPPTHGALSPVGLPWWRMRGPLGSLADAGPRPPSTSHTSAVWGEQAGSQPAGGSGRCGSQVPPTQGGPSQPPAPGSGCQAICPLLPGVPGGCAVLGARPGSWRAEVGGGGAEAGQRPALDGWTGAGRAGHPGGGASCVWGPGQQSSRWAGQDGVGTLCSIWETFCIFND